MKMLVEIEVKDQKTYDYVAIELNKLVAQLNDPSWRGYGFTKPIKSLKISDASHTMRSNIESLDQPRIITKSGVCGGCAIIRGTRIPVWGLEQARRLGVSDDALLRMYPSLVPNDLEAAWKYVDNYPEEIDREIRANEDA